MNDYKDSLAGFANRIKADAINTPLQQIKPIPAKVAEAQLNVELPKSLLKAVKQACLEKEMKIKEFVVEALEKQLR